MGIFKLVQLNNSSYATPQEMYSDMRNRKIQSLFNHQSVMIDYYMQEIESENIALELPTGSGKTLVGLLIGEFRRRTRKEKVVYCCPNKQLANQVCSLSNAQYGIDARAFLGSKRHYDFNDKACYESAGCIAVTTYSAIFNTNPYFKDADFIILDDAHSAENYITSLWSLEISADSQPQLFERVISIMHPLLKEEEFKQAIDGSGARSLSSRIILIPLVAAREQISKLQSVFDSFIYDYENDGCFSWSMLRDNLDGCVMYISNNSLLIRPIIPPVQQFAPFMHAHQRLYMSGTLSKRGELERTFGLQEIKSLPMLDQWRDCTTGRRLFMFPNIAQGNMPTEHLVKKIITNREDRYLMMVSSNAVRDSYQAIISALDKPVFIADDLEESKRSFVQSQNGVAILASRLDGLDFPDGECRNEIIVQLPMATNMHERFLVESAHSEELYSERIRNRITQALGRCTRSQTDYAVIYILDENVMRLLSTPRVRSLLNSELQAEIEFGLENAKEHGTVEDYLELTATFLDDRSSWELAEQNIIALRKKKVEEKSSNCKVADILKSIVGEEISCSLNIWNRQFETAKQEAKNIIEKIREVESLEGYFSYWSYILYHIIAACDAAENRETQLMSIDILNAARAASPYNAWIIDRNIYQAHGRRENATMLARLKKTLAMKMSKNNICALRSSLNDLVNRLATCTGKEFENAHTELGEWLGYKSYNFDSTGAPDPIWIIDACTCIVAEDKIYESDCKPIPIRHVDEAKRHESWVRSKEDLGLNKDAKVITIFLTNTDRIHEAAVNVAEGVWWVGRKEFVEWASKAILALEDYLCRDINPKDDPEFDIVMSRELFDVGVDSFAFLEFVQHKKLANLKTTK